MRTKLLAKRGGALELNQSLVRVCLYRVSQSERKKEVSNPTRGIRTCALLSKQAWPPASFSSVVGRKKEVSNPTRVRPVRSAFKAAPAPSQFFFRVVVSLVLGIGIEPTQRGASNRRSTI